MPRGVLTLGCNPYEDPSCATTPPQEYADLGDAAVCALVYDAPNATAIATTNTTATTGDACSSYTLQSFPSRAAFEADPAASARGVVTHVGACGLCSTAQDLSVYLAQDFTTAGKACATKGLANATNGQACYESLGLTPECAKIWNYDGIFDGSACLKPCTANLFAPNNGPPPACALSPCLECDEVEAGPLFSSFGGRTRRRSGLLSEIVRNCSSIATGIAHDPSQQCPPSAPPAFAPATSSSSVVAGAGAG